MTPLAIGGAGQGQRHRDGAPGASTVQRTDALLGAQALELAALDFAQARLDHRPVLGREHAFEIRAQDVFWQAAEELAQLVVQTLPVRFSVSSAIPTGACSTMVRRRRSL